MLSSTLFAAALYAVAVTAAEPSDISSCSSGPASKYLTLANFPPAQTYCSDNYAAPATVTETSCATPTASTGASKRDDNGSPQWRGDHGRPSSDAILFKQLMDESSSLQSTLCSCIGTQPQIVTIQTTCASNEYCEANTSTCKVQRNCKNPASCDGHSFCGKGPSGNNLFCHQDTDDSDMGYWPEKTEQVDHERLSACTEFNVDSNGQPNASADLRYESDAQ
ncbi:hypothetical protein M409DRAFT_16010 [Zasmidium cellare ATCC 36951]|uniref:Uncharacterized protein n=1 Tax=Zasmidium cellare ATCC 36951 TaxID=1080233 RepID=A0A6A6D7Y0_ZASCE|nr:uncharacterized protein M409DRAFT_16010 [Zasmidium cellare ATCC 36951]KAF2173736.1 hypothetical protein M409DRAFT_16010 [Zasmidium cellare ATCC 36951]